MHMHAVSVAALLMIWTEILDMPLGRERFFAIPNSNTHTSFGAWMCLPCSRAKFADVITARRPALLTSRVIQSKILFANIVPPLGKVI